MNDDDYQQHFTLARTMLNIFEEDKYLKIIIISDEAHFHLIGLADNQNCPKKIQHHKSY